MKTDIRDRNDLKILVDAFYKRIRNDDELGPIFNKIVTNWPEHLDKITNFWNQHIFGVQAYQGNPIQVHNKVDAFCNHQITAHNFGTWLFYWIQTLDELYEGKNVDLLKFKARKMQTIFFVSMVKNRTP